VSKRVKLLAAIRNNPKNVRLDDACKVARWLGFTEEGISGSHHTFARPGELTGLNFQPRKDGTVPPYQAKQLIALMDKYDSTTNDTDDDKDGTPDA